MMTTATSVNRILFVTLSNIGDAVMTTPTLEALHLQYPHVKMDIVCDARSAILFEHCPYLGQILIKKKQASWRETLRFIGQLRQQRYDIAVDLRSDFLLYFVRANQRVFKLKNKVSMHLHSVEKHFLALHKTVDVPMPNPVLWVPQPAQKEAEHILSAYPQARILALGLGANFAGKIWPVAQFQWLSHLLKAQFDVILLLGGAQEASLAQTFQAESVLPVIDCCGKTDLLTTAALLMRARYFVGNDSGLGHIASAVGTSSFTVFGVGQPHRYRPWGAQALWVQDAQWHIENVSATEVAEKIQEALCS